MSETKWSEKDRVLPSRNSGESQFGRVAIRGEKDIVLLNLQCNSQEISDSL
ncbi:hypothetical protein FXV91_10915 [Methanosarcina sp. DH2]|uniref:hypothetical protein n=1 Tax=Methanosarcina sp. DH2 TaxID=2605639 RepID=UPI001E652A8E|nr:hypothetical protein [Methanosarcina sp. DH2]MCC4770673.1 hypothetical protein [Methanosarcina sp. DH2]